MPKIASASTVWNTAKRASVPAPFGPPKNQVPSAPGRLPSCKAVLALPVVLAVSVFRPIAVLSKPFVFAASACTPMAVLLYPTMVEFPAPPTKKFPAAAPLVLPMLTSCAAFKLVSES